jgi:tripartite-type tricarboxylate transporter receptor subunit TctC
LSTRAALGAAAMALLVSSAAALDTAGDSYPSRIIRIVVPFPAGGLNDNVARVIAPFLQERIGQAIVIENKSGASGIIGTDAVAKAKPDGYTLAVVASSHTVTPATNPRMPFETERDLTAVGLLARDPLLFVAGPKSGARTLTDLVSLARTQAGTLTYATPGPDSQSHFVTELFNKRAGISALQVPYRGGAPAVLSLIAGETDYAVLSEQLSGSQIKAGKLWRSPVAAAGAAPAIPMCRRWPSPGSPEWKRCNGLACWPQPTLRSR